MRVNELNCLYKGASDRKHTYDLVIPDNYRGCTLLFMHGFMGFKDWGCWSLMMEHFVRLGFGFCRFNISHNGTTVDQPIDFIDLQAFGNDTYYNELTDLRIMIDLVRNKIEKVDKLVLIGHSRGGGIVLLEGGNEKVSAVVSLAGISNIGKRFPTGEQLQKWRKEGVKYVHNSRTDQDLPQYFLQYEDFQMHQDELSIRKSCEHLKKPVLLIHGNEDTSVSIDEGVELSHYCKTDLKVIRGADHTFCSKHPWNESEMPTKMAEVCTEIEHFLMTL